MNWELRIGRSARKNLARFPKKDQINIAKAFREFIFSPFIGDIQKIRGEKDIWRRRIGSYRVIYEIDLKQNIISVLDIRRRTSVTY